MLLFVSQQGPHSWEWRSRPSEFSNPARLLIVLFNVCPKPRLLQVGMSSFLLHARLVLILHLSNSWSAPQDTSRIPCCSRTVSLGYPRISGRSRISRVFPENTISCLSTLRFGFNRDRLTNKVPAHCCVSILHMCAQWGVRVYVHV